MGPAARASILAAVALSGAGCASMIGGATAGLTDKHILPVIMASGDVGVGCAAGEALGSMVAGFADESRKAARASVTPALSAGMCLEDDVWEAQLAGARALYAESFHEVRDAVALEQRHHLVAAARYLTAYERLEEEYGIPEPGEDCPKLKSDSDQLTYLLGLSAGMLAVIHDAGSGRQAGVPMSIPAGVVRASHCLDDDRWWGAPAATRAGVWALQPEHPDAEDPWATFASSIAKGDAAGVRLASAFLVQTAETVGDDARVRDAVRHHFVEVPEDLDPDYAMLDVYAGLIVRHASDRRWTAEVGHRTPLADLGTFPSDAQPETPDLDDDLFEDMLTE